jgi:hypothetical protein
MNADLDYDPTTDSLYIKLCAGESVDNRIVSDDVVIDLGADGNPSATTSNMPAVTLTQSPKRWAISGGATRPRFLSAPRGGEVR